MVLGPTSPLQRQERKGIQVNTKLEAYIKRVDPDIYESMSEIENFEEIVEAIHGDAGEIQAKLGGLGSGVNVETIAYLFSMQNRAINQLIEEIEELRPSIRFITSVLLGNVGKEEGDDV